MDFGGIIREAWTMTWRYRFLWILGLLAGPAFSLPSGGNGFQWRGDRTDLNQVPPQAARFVTGAEAWAVANVGLLIALALVVVLVGLALVVLSMIAQGAITRAAAELDNGQTVSLGSAWRAGVHLVWRYVGLWLLAALAAILVAAVIGGLVALGFGFVAASGSGAAGAVLVSILAAVALIVAFDWFVLTHTTTVRAPRWVVLTAATLFALPLFTVFIVAAIAFSIAFTFAGRSIAVDDVGPWDALKRGWRLMSERVVDSALVWLVNVALGIGAAVVGIALAIAAAAILGGVGALLWFTLGLGAIFAGYAVLGGLTFILGGCLVAGIVGTFLWNYWTIAYLRMVGRESRFAGA